ncbi:hypothetical protein OCU04_003315 [Sclerotinia nivalis]|uniref:Uncharacterized protein n=1 Tax=Sclerotinia nivalis TaxID=352851 RepID=A0A9X0DMK6_9HELO|nr:hypothetical protein OCU04_003315 [Sclerotinia nivalis]
MMEAFNATKKDLPIGVDLNLLAKWISNYHKTFTAGSFPSALIDIANGHIELYDVLWVINRGKRSTPPVYCPEHERIVQLAKDRAKIQKERETERLEKEYADRIQEQRKAKFGIRYLHVNTPDPFGGVERLSKLEYKRQKKERRIKESLGKQEMPVNYATPQIQKLGSSEQKPVSASDNSDTSFVRTSP